MSLVLLSLSTADDDHMAIQPASPTEKPIVNPSTMDSASVLTQLGKGYGTSSRGGLRVFSRSGTDTCDVLRVNRPFLLGPVDQDEWEEKELKDLDQAWLGKLVNWYQQTLDAKQPIGRKSRFKRPREAPAIPNFGPKAQGLPSKRTHLEADETILSHGTLDLHANMKSLPIAQKHWCLNVTLSAGRNVKGLRKRQRDGELDSWSKVPASTLPMEGDFRSEPVNKPVPLLSASSRSVTSTWKAVLAAAEAFEKNLENVRLDALLDFFDHVRRLPHPSQVLDETTRIAQTVNECLGRLWKACTEARKLRATLMDLWYSEGVELDAARKALKASIPLLPDEMEELERQLSVVTEWQTRLDKALEIAAEDDPNFERDDLVSLESLALEADYMHGFQSKGLATLLAKLQKTYEMRDKLESWKNEPGTGVTVKTISNMVRDIQRLKIKFREANELLLYSRDIDSWVERADIAIRSRISLPEIEDLIRRGSDYRLDLSEYQDKLQSRVQQAKAWLENLEAVVDLNGGRLEWMSKIRSKIGEGMNNELHELACDGSRLPVEIDFVQMIHIELDARQWSLKAQKWIPSPEEAMEESKQGKIEELREHLEKAAALRGRLPLSDRSKWILEFEKELTELVDAADKWLTVQYEYYFEGDNRKATSRRSISIEQLRQIDEDAKKIPVNLGSVYATVNRFLVQAETWYDTHQMLLVHAGLECLGDASTAASSEGISLEQLKLAMDDANYGIAFDLEEVDKVSSLIKKLETWFEKVSVVTGTGKRRIRGKRTTYTIEEIRSIIDEASELPVDTSEAVQILKDRIASVRDWQKRVTVDVDAIASAFEQMREAINSSYGIPSTYSRDINVESGRTPEADGNGTSADVEMTDAELEPSLQNGFSTSTIDEMIHELTKEIVSSSITTPEMELVSNVEHLSRWVARSVKYLSESDDIFDKRFFGAFDRFLSEGKDLCGCFSVVTSKNQATCNLNQSSSQILNDQLMRMNVLMSDRDKFSFWCAQAAKILSKEDKRCTAEKLQEMKIKSDKFPRDNEHVKEIRELSERTNEWVAAAKRIIDSEERLKLPELKAQIDEGEKLGIQSVELRELRNGLKAAKSWATRVRKSKPELITTKMSDVSDLVDEYEALMVEMPEEIAKLNKAMKHYCICRGHNEGQMISCDDCNDSFHASCLGFSKVRALKMEKYVCVRCSVKKAYQTSAAAIAGVVRKWTNDKELHKARQCEAQKHHRKTRKEQKDIEKYRATADEVARRISQIDALKCQLLSDNGATEPGHTKEAPSLGSETQHELSGCSKSFVQPQVHPDSTQPTIEPTEQSLTVENGEEAVVSDMNSLDSQRNDLVAEMDNTTKAIGLCHERLKALEVAAGERTSREELENAQAAKLQRWCMFLRNVIAPKTKEESDLTRPGKDGQLSEAMETVMVEAEKLGVTSCLDVSTVENSFKCMCWSSRAMEVLRRQPSCVAIEALVAQGQKCKLPEDKPLKALRAMLQRASAWNVRFRKALTPVPGSTECFDVAELNELSKSAERVPLILPYEHRLENVIEDEGCRYCLCGGPSDGRFMVGCDKCDKWFHGSCVGIRGNEGEELENWFCPECKSSPVDISALVDTFHDSYECEVEDSEEDDVASKAPDPESMWPPYGLRDSARATEALGVEISFHSSNSNEAKSEYTEKTPSQGSLSRLPTVSSSSSENIEAIQEDPCRVVASDARNDDDKSSSQDESAPDETSKVSTTEETPEEKQLVSSGSAMDESLSCVPDSEASTLETSPAKSAAASLPERAEKGEREHEHSDHHTYRSHDRSLAPHMQIVESESPLRVDTDKQGEVTIVAS
eukprot:scaffold528_cov165-Amphora_coffeaeformis.AAC.6